MTSEFNSPDFDSVVYLLNNDISSLLLEQKVTRKTLEKRQT